MYLNPTLHSLLESRLGEVKVINPGVSMTSQYKFDPYYGRTVLDVTEWGETYCVNCPYCKESRQRLYINHRYGVWDSIAESYHYRMARCFNEECLKREHELYKDLTDKIFGLINPASRRNICYSQGKPSTIPELGVLKEAPSPGCVVPLQELSSSHPAVEYLSADRKYDVSQLIDRYSLMYCGYSPLYPLVANRIIIPIVQDSIWVGWQGRYIGEGWKTVGVPKYYTLPSMPKRLVLYNHDTAFKQTAVVVTEGPTSSWSVYPYGVALLGKEASAQQCKMLVEAGKDKTIILLLDGSASVEQAVLYNRLKPRIDNLLAVNLPDDKDPGDYHHRQNELWSLIAKTADEYKITLPKDLISRSK